MPETPTSDDFGVFNPILASVHNYLPLLSLTDRDVKKRVRAVHSCLGDATTAHTTIAPLLDGLNWRPHLVAAIALAQYGYEPTVFAKLWQAIDMGSWVTPQLVAVAFLHDPDFTAQALLRMKSRPLESGETSAGLTEEEHGLETEHAGLLHLSPKAAAALARLLSLLPEKSEFLTAELESEEIKKLLREDYDDAGDIAQRWLDKLKPLQAQL